MLCKIVLDCKGVVGDLLRVLHAGKLEHLFKKDTVSLMDGRVLRFYVIIPVAYTQAALSHIENLVGAVHQVSLDVCPEKTALSFEVHFSECRCKLFFVRNSIDLLNVFLQRCSTLCIQTGGIEPLFVEVHYFLLHGTGFGFHCGH